jgi:hypothetical protein
MYMTRDGTLKVGHTVAGDDQPTSTEQWRFQTYGKAERRDLMMQRKETR